MKKLHAEFEFLVSEQLLPVAHHAEVPHYVARIADYLDDFARRQTSQSAQVLETLSSRYRLILVSNFYGNLHAVVERYGLDRYFETIVESAVVGVRKPDPAIWQLGVDAAGCAAADCVAVGDSYDKDILPARAVGCQTVWFKGEEWKPTERDETLPTHVITSLSQLLHYYPA
ncbi:MAG: HAD family hydrolase [Prevotella sp.]